LAKLASDHRKPNGQYVITPEMGQAFVETLPVGKFLGIGPATAARLNSFGIHMDHRRLLHEPAAGKLI
jgi:DNA polymerase IV